MCGALHLRGHMPDPQQRVGPPHQPTAGAAGIVGTFITLLGGFDGRRGSVVTWQAAAKVSTCRRCRRWRQWTLDACQHCSTTAATWRRSSEREAWKH
jgi:hypothetical protein